MNPSLRQEPEPQAGRPKAGVDNEPEDIKHQEVPEPEAPKEADPQHQEVADSTPEAPKVAGPQLHQGDLWAAWSPTYSGGGQGEGNVHGDKGKGKGTSKGWPPSLGGGYGGKSEGAQSGLKKTRLCEAHLGMRFPNYCQRPDCFFAHRLAELEVPNESHTLGTWAKVWSEGEVDIIFWPGTYRSPKSQERFRCAFKWEQAHAQQGIPYLAWGLAYDCGGISPLAIPPTIPKDFDWPRLRNAWEHGRRSDIGCRESVRGILNAPARPQIPTPPAVPTPPAPPKAPSASSAGPTAPNPAPANPNATTAVAGIQYHDFRIAAGMLDSPPTSSETPMPKSPTPTPGTSACNKIRK